jgi:hypothetical protein
MQQASLVWIHLIKAYLLLLDHGVMKLFKRVIQGFSHHILTMKREKEDIWFCFDIKSEK